MPNGPWTLSSDLMRVVLSTGSSAPGKAEKVSSTLHHWSSSLHDTHTHSLEEYRSPDSLAYRRRSCKSETRASGPSTAASASLPLPHGIRQRAMTQRQNAPPAENKETDLTRSEVEEAEEVALVRFRVRECCLYSAPPASSIGHRAELWDVDHWLQELSLQVVSVGDVCYVRLFDKESGELFAECPMPEDHTKFHTVVEPVIDSSRYFVLKVVDRESNRHAFIGIGFRERGQASDFNAALDDHRSYLRRKAEAAQLAVEHGELREDGPSQKTDMSIKGTIHLKMDKLTHGAKSSSSSLFKNGLAALRTGHGTQSAPKGVLLPPPPPPPPQVSGAFPAAQAATETPTQGGWAEFDHTNAGGDGAEDSEWGDFEGTST